MTDDITARNLAAQLAHTGRRQDPAKKRGGKTPEAKVTAACAVLLSLDLSSTNIGWVVYAGTVRDYGTIKLTGIDVADRCRQAFAAVGLIIETHPDIDCVAIESPVARFAKAVIPQARVSGAVLARAALFGLHVIEVAPSQAKRQLSGQGNATKEEMQRAAACYGVAGEHASDALGIALFAIERVFVC